MKYLKYLILVVCFTLLTWANEGIAKPFLWEVEKGDTQFYLFGTMHLGDPALQILPEELKEAIDKSDEVRTEVPMDASLQMKSVSLMMRSDTKQLKQILSPLLYQRTEAYLATINPQLNLIPFEKMKIWALSTVVAMLKNQLKYPTLQAIDAEIYTYAEQKNKGVGGIETVEEQIGAMEKFNLAEQIIGLESTLDYLETNPNFVEEMKNRYKSGDEKVMMVFIENTMFKIEKYKSFEDKFMQVLLYDRNKKMTERIESLVHTSPKKQYLFAFGVMHFLGEKSILSLLQAKGYHIKRVQ